MPDFINTFLTQAANGRWYYTAKTFSEWFITINDGTQVPMLAPKSTTDLSKLPDSAITVALLPKDYNGWTKDDLISAGFPETMKINPVDGTQVTD